MNKLFCYGTLNLHDVQDWLWDEQKQGLVSKLDDYVLKQYDNGIYYIDKEFGETVAGKIYEITDKQLKKTDAYETSAYTRESVTIDGLVVNVYVRSKENESKVND